MNTIIDALYAYFADCPLMAGNRLNIDYLPADTSQAGVEYAIFAIPANEVIYPYRNGGARCRYVFAVGSILDYDPDAAQNICNSGFSEALADWLRKQTRLRSLPKLPAGLTPRSIRAIGSGYLYQPDVNAGKYQIQCELEYYRKGEQEYVVK